jgi:hypothetical protein
MLLIYIYFAPNGAKYQSTWIVSVCDTDDRMDATVPELLPGAFGPRNLA